MERKFSGLLSHLQNILEGDEITATNNVAASGPSQARKPEQGPFTVIAR